MNRLTKIIPSVLLISGLCRPGAHAAVGLSTQFVDVVLENLNPGLTYNIRELRGVPYTIRNGGDSEIEVLIEVRAPTKEELKPQYEPIPDPSWVQIQPERHKLLGGAMGFSDVIIAVPDDPALKNRHFQAVIWAHSIGTENMFAVGVNTRLRFSTGLGPESLEAEKRAKAMVKLNFDIWPQTLYAVKVIPGAEYDLKKAEKKSIKITNRAEESLDLVIKSIPWDPRLGLLEGYEAAPNSEWLRLEPEKVTIEPDSVKDIKLYFNIPEEMRGRKFAFLIQAGLPIGTPVSASNKVFVTVLGEEDKTGGVKAGKETDNTSQEKENKKE